MRDFRDGDYVLLQGNNASAVRLVDRCRERNQMRPEALTRTRGVLELGGGWVFQAEHVPDVTNTATDGNSRWEVSPFESRLRSLSPDIR